MNDEERKLTQQFISWMLIGVMAVSAVVMAILLPIAIILKG